MGDLVLTQADAAVAALRKDPSTVSLDGCKRLLKSLRDARQFARLCDLAELVSRHLPGDPLVLKLHAQGLIECDRLMVAVEFLAGAIARTEVGDPEYPELQGLRGRAYKQLFVATPSSNPGARADFLQRAVAAYKVAYDANPQRYWHGINLSGLANAAERLEIDISAESSVEYARSVLATLGSIPESARDEWWAPTKAEAHVALKQLPDAEVACGIYLRDPRVSAFQIGSTVRQLRQIWAIHNSKVGAGLLQILEADLARRPGAVVAVDPEHMRMMRELQSVDDAQLQRTTGSTNRTHIRWYRAGLERAACVAAVCEELGPRLGTGFAVRSGDFFIQPENEILLLTNWHVLNSSGYKGRNDFGNIEVRFEAASPAPLSCRVRSVVAESRASDGLDYCLFRLRDRRDGVQIIKLTRAIAKGDSKVPVYVIGHALGDELQFSLYDNWLLDHECEPEGKPPRPERRRVHYSASTDPGSSGSPVFDETWTCIALHRAGAKVDPPRSAGLYPLNDGEDMVSANEGIWIGSIQDDVQKKNIVLGP